MQCCIDFRQSLQEYTSTAQNFPAEKTIQYLSTLDMHEKKQETNEQFERSK